MNMQIKTIPGTLFLLLMLTLPIGHSAQSVAVYPVAGTTPWQRPGSAPVIEWVKHDATWFKKAVTGVTPPYPRSLYFLDNQGDWYTPFIHRGMTGPYDIRGWH